MCEYTRQEVVAFISENKKFEQFLNDNDCYENYVSNMVDPNIEVGVLIGDLWGDFIWDTSIEGYHYWSNLADKLDNLTDVENEE